MSSDSRYPKHRNNETPNKGFKRQHNRMWKANYKRQFRRWLADPTFEIIEQERRHSARWEWN